MMQISPKALAAMALVAVPTAASAHPALYHHTHTFMAGVSHPLTGLDHLLAMISVGLLTSQKGGRALLLWPGAFVAAMIAGGVLGMEGFALPLVEPVIACSLLVLGLMIATLVELPMIAGIAIIASFGLFHGNVHGLEAPASGAAALYGLGFVLSTVTLHVLGLALGLAAQQRSRAQVLLRFCAVAIAVTGGALLFT